MFCVGRVFWDAPLARSLRIWVRAPLVTFLDALSGAREPEAEDRANALQHKAALRVFLRSDW
jgi:hypothetical protein